MTPEAELAYRYLINNLPAPTEERKAIYRFVCEFEVPFTVEDLMETLEEEGRKVSRSTIFRRLLQLESLNLIIRVGPKYDPKYRRVLPTELQNQSPMPASEFSPAAQVLRTWIQRQATAEGMAWLEGRIEEISSGDVKALYTGFAMAPRRVGKVDLVLSPADLDAASEARLGWDPRGWSIDQAARSLLVLSLPAPEPQAFVTTLDRMFAAAEMGEAVALYQMLPLLPHPAAHRFRCTEGIRSNIKAVFAAVAHRNPFPAEQLDEAAWNQLVLKSLFVGITLDPIVGLDRRANATLRQMLVDFAHERRAAHRQIPLELWRCVGPYADTAALDDLELTLKTGLPAEQQAAALALASSSSPRAFQLLSAHPELQSKVTSGEISWKTLADA